jgi:glycosidase
MSPWPRHPVVHEIFTWVWLAELTKFAGQPVTLADVPDSVWDDIARPGIDAVWLMGVWQRSQEGARIAATNPAMRGDAERALPGLDDADIVGSAYCVRDYVVDDHLGGDEGLAVARARLAERGVRLVLDFVPNHVAPDHHWTRSHPEYFVHGTAADLERDPASFIDVDGHVLACGRDPYFPAWPEVVQFDASSVEVRRAVTTVVSEIADRCDGVRCDMAMLMLDDIFVRTWGDRATGGAQPDGGRGYWPPIIESVRATHPDFVFWAEAYWDLEPVLVEQGFDACYDKRLYDRMVHREPAESIRAHLGADPAYQQHMLRFVENHDEPRAASLFERPAHQTALTMVMTLPGVALLHEGEADGRTVRVPVTLGRRPVEATDAQLHRFVDQLLAALADGLRRGAWQLAPIDGWPDNRSCERLMAWTWTQEGQGHLVVVNPSRERADGMVRLPWGDLHRACTLTDLLSGEEYERNGDQINTDGLYVALEPDAVHLLHVPR